MSEAVTVQKILAFLKKHTLTVISTIHTDSARPESAVIAFSEHDNLELVFGTSNKTRKYKNLQENPHVSFVIGWDHSLGTVQYEGIARELSTEESAAHSATQIQKNPGSAKFANRDDQRYFLVTPTWIRLTDMSTKPQKILEINF